MMRRGTHRVELLDQQLERHILIAVGIERLLPHPLQHLAEPVRAIHTHPQHPRVDEKPDEIIERLIQPPGDRRAHHHVLTDPDPMQQHRHHRLQHHRGGRVMRRRQRLDPRPHLRVDAHLHRVTAITGHRRAGPIQGQRHHLGQPSQLIRQ